MPFSSQFDTPETIRSCLGEFIMTIEGPSVCFWKMSKLASQSEGLMSTDQ